MNLAGPRGWIDGPAGQRHSDTGVADANVDRQRDRVHGRHRRGRDPHHDIRPEAPEHHEVHAAGRHSAG
jgi:hypothetical protein